MDIGLVVGSDGYRLVVGSDGYRLVVGSDGYRAIVVVGNDEYRRKMRYIVPGMKKTSVSGISNFRYSIPPCTEINALFGLTFSVK